jgi:ABC-type branched-subunit amino acid transport system ATPase component
VLYPKLLLLDKPSQGLMPLIVRDVFKVMFFFGGFLKA